MREFIQRNEQEDIKRNNLSNDQENDYEEDGLKMAESEPMIKMMPDEEDEKMSDGNQSLDKYTEADPSMIQMQEDEPKITMGHTFTHEVDSGETLWDISIKYNISLDALRTANPQTQTRKQKDQINTGETLKIPNQNTLKKVEMAQGLGSLTVGKYGDMQKRWEDPVGWGYGPHIIMKYQASQNQTIDPEQIDYVQTIHTNIDREAFYLAKNPEEAKKVGLKDTYFVDQMTVGNLDNAKFYGTGGDLSETELPSFGDMPFLASHPDTTIFFRAETSLVVKEPGNFRRLLTFTWGYTVTPKEFTTLEPIIYQSAPSNYHSTILTKLNINI